MPRSIFIILVTAIRGMSRPETCFLPGQLGLTTKDRSGDSLSGCGSSIQSSKWEAQTIIELPPRHWNVRRQCLGVRWCYDVPLGVTEEPTIREKGLSLPWLFTVISCKAFWSDFERRGNTKRELPERYCLLVCGRMSPVSFGHKTFDWGGGNIFIWRGRCKNWGTIFLE